MRQRMQKLYMRGGALSEQNDLLAAAFEELEFALEQLQSAEAQQRLQHEEWLNFRAELENETKDYQQLFIQAPAGYLVTSIDGTIRKANGTAGTLLQIPEKNLIGRSLVLFVPEGQRRSFRTYITQAAQADGVQEWELTMQGWEGGLFDAGLTVVAVRGKAAGRPIALHWLLRDIRAWKQAEQSLDKKSHLAGLSGTVSHSISADRQPADANSKSAKLARERFSFLSKSSTLMTLSQDIDLMLGHIAHMVVPAIADGCVIDLAEPQTGAIQQLVVVRESHSNKFVRTWRHRYMPEQKLTRAVGEALVLPAATLPQAIAKPEKGARDLQNILGALEPTSAIVAPLQSEERVLGSLTLVLANADRQYDAVDVAMAEELAWQLVSAIERIRR